MVFTIVKSIDFSFRKYKNVKMAIWLIATHFVVEGHIISGMIHPGVEHWFFHTRGRCPVTRTFRWKREMTFFLSLFYDHGEQERGGGVGGRVEMYSKKSKK